MTNVIIGCVSGLLAIGILCTAGFQCSETKAKAIGQCIDRTEEVLGCEKAFEKINE